MRALLFDGVASLVLCLSTKCKWRFLLHLSCSKLNAFSIAFSLTRLISNEYQSKYGYFYRIIEHRLSLLSHRTGDWLSCDNHKRRWRSEMISVQTARIHVCTSALRARRDRMNICKEMKVSKHHNSAQNTPGRRARERRVAPCAVLMAITEEDRISMPNATKNRRNSTQLHVRTPQIHITGTQTHIHIHTYTKDPQRGCAGRRAVSRLTANKDA